MILDFKTASMKAKTWWETVFKILTENDLNFCTQPKFFWGAWGGAVCTMWACRRTQQPTPVFWPGKFPGQRSLVG